MAASTGRHFVGLLVGLAALGAPALASAQEGQGPAQVENGFALEASLGARFGVIASGDSGTFGGTALQTGLIGGYKFGRVLLGLGLEFSNLTTSATTASPLGGGNITTTTSISEFLIGPDLQAALVRTADGRVELIGDLSLHFGHASTNVSVSSSPLGGTSPATDSNFLLSYVIAPGVRYWIHPHFAFQAIAGFGGDAYIDIPVGNTPMDGNHSEHGIVTSFGALGIF